MSTSIQRRTIHTFALVALVPVLLTAVAYRCQSEFRDDVEWVRQTHQILNRIETVLNLVNEAETGQRGFLITGDNAYLQPYEAAKQKIRGQVRELRRQLAQDPPGDRLAADLEDEIGEKFRELGLTITTRRAKGAEAAFGVVKSNRGQEIMEQIRQTVDAMRSHEGDLLEQRVSAERTTAALFTAAFVLGSLVTVVLLVWALRTIRHYEAETETATIAVRSLNDELERRVEVRTQELQRSNEDLQRFAYVASHDLQEPLRMVGGYVGLLERRYRGKLDADADQFIQFAVAGAKRMQDLINDLLTCARSGTEPLAKRPISVQAIVDQAISNLQRTIAESGAEIVCDHLPELEADETKLVQVFQNLLSNSIKFRRPGAKLQIHIGARRHGSAWVFTVADNGIGFDSKHADRIFLMFQRLHGVGKYQGTGIGLAIVRRIVEAHGGEISAEGQPDQGATFTFTLPAAAVKPRTARSAEAG